MNYIRSAGAESIAELLAAGRLSCYGGVFRAYDVGRRNVILDRSDVRLQRAPVAYFEASHPEQNILSDIRRVVGDALEMPRRENEMHIRRDPRRVLRHSREQAFENPVAVLVHDVVAFEN